MSEIRKYLELSTGHVTKEDRELFDDGDPKWPFNKHEYGWWVWVPDILDDYQAEMFAESGLSHNVWAAIHYARSHGCDWIRYDCDAIASDDLPFFEW